MLEVVRCHRLFPSCALSDPAAALAVRLWNSPLATRNLRGLAIAIAIGSRGIDSLSELTAVLVKFLRERGAQPFIVPAMGSHGGATAEGQAGMLASLGITEALVGAPVRSGVETVVIGSVNAAGVEWPIHQDRLASAADGIIIMNRVKPHTDFSGEFESGLMKGLVVGLGNDAGARVIHARGTLGLRQALPLMAREVLARGRVVAGVALVEDAHHEIARIEVPGCTEIPACETELLREARELAADLPVDTLDGLVVGRMGKDLSGTGIDTNVVGRRAIAGEADPPRPRIRLIGVCDLTPVSKGNALGVGIADLVTAKLADGIDRETTATNTLTTTFLDRGRLPLVLRDDRALVGAMIAHLQRSGIAAPRLLFIRDTLHLGDFHVTPPLAEELRERADVEISTAPAPLEFSVDGSLQLDFESVHSLSDKAG